MSLERRDDAFWIRRALELARKGLAGASPNPLVGCVIVKAGRAIGEGYHRNFGGPHAEIAALKQAGNARGATAYTNLEPCNHWGKTGPCSEALIRAGIKRVVSSLEDPNPLVRGKGFKRLRSARIKVKTGILAAEARQLNRPFIKFITQKKPYVILKAAMSLDGKTATRSGESQWITGPDARRFSWKLRGEVDAILVGAETVRKDNPSLTSHGLGRDPVKIVVSASGNVPKRSKIFKSKSPCWIIRGKNKRPLDFNDLLLELGQRGISKLLIEGGAKTLGWALDSGQVDECLIFIAPMLIGGEKAQPAIAGKGFAKLKEALKFSRTETSNIGSDVLIRAIK